MILTETRIAMYLKMGEFGSLHAYQVTQIPVNRNIGKQLKAIRERKHKEYLQSTCRKSLSQENIVETNEKNDWDKTNGQPNDTRKKIELKNEQDERDNESCWPSGTCAMVGDSMVNGIHAKNMVTLKFFISGLPELKILINIAYQSSKTNQITWSVT